MDTAVAGNTLRIMIVDDHPTVCEGLGQRISAQPDMSVCGEAADVQAALEKIPRLRPDVLIVDIALRNSDGLELVKAVKTRHKYVRTLVHSMYDDAVYADRCLHAGALGYVNKEADPGEVIRGIREVHAGRVHLSPTAASAMLARNVAGYQPRAGRIETLTDRQLEVFRLIGEGKTAAQIAGRLHISVHTFETHRENIKRKLNVRTASKLSRLAVLWTTENR